MQFFMDDNKQEGLNDNHTHINSAVNLMFTKNPSSRGINMFGEIVV